MKNKTYRKTLVFISLFIFLCLTKTAISEEKSENTFLSFGMSEIEPTNKALSRGKALKECLMDAVRQYTAQIVNANLLQANNDVLIKKIYENYNLFLRNYRIKEEQEEGGYYKITAEVRLKTTLLTEKLNSLGMLQKTKDKPKLLILVSDTETTDGNPTDSSWWVNDIKGETAKYSIHTLLENRFKFMGFELIEKTKFLSALNDAKVSLKKRIIRGNVDTIRKFRFRDILLSGSTNLSIGSQRRNPDTISMDISTYNLRNGRSLSKVSRTYNLSYIIRKLKEDDKPASLNDAIINAADDFAAELVISFLKKWYASGVNTRVVEIKVRDMYSYKRYKELKDLLVRLKPDVIKISDTEIEKGVYVWEMEISSTSKHIAKKLSGKSIDGKAIKILSVSRKKIVVGLR